MLTRRLPGSWRRTRFCPQMTTVETWPVYRLYRGNTRGWRGTWLPWRIRYGLLTIDLASVQALQRKHEGVERDLAALEDKVMGVLL